MLTEPEIEFIGNDKPLPELGCYSSVFFTSRGEFFPEPFLFFTHSVSRYSICPLMDRNSSAAQEEISSYNSAEMRRGICFFLSLT